MNWYKKAQQGLLFYPWAGSPNINKQRVDPISIDQETGQNIYKCHTCDNTVLEKDVYWYVDKGEEREERGEKFQLPQYNEKIILQGLIEVSQILAPALMKLEEYIEKEKLEAKRNDTYDYGYTTALSRWETQIPQIINIRNKYPILSEICSYRNQGWGSTHLCGILREGFTGEINGRDLIALKDFVQNPQSALDGFTNYSNKNFNINYEVPSCEECYDNFDKCEMCDKHILPDDNKYETTWDDTSYICEECVESGRVDVCSSCGKADTSEDMIYMENEGFACKECYEEGSDKQQEWAENIISQLNIPIGKNYPISKKDLSNLNNFLDRYLGKFGSNTLNHKEWGRIIHLAKKSRLSEGAMEYLHFIETNWDNAPKNGADINEDIENNIEAQDYMKQSYPNISSYKDIPFDIDVVSNFNKNKQGFTITITPSKKFFEYAKNKYPNIETVWDKMSYTPHHNGVLAYARCAYEGGDSLVINNLQRDADLDNYNNRSYRTDLSNKKAAEWLNNTTKNWDTFLLDLLKSIGISEDISVYLTTFDQQKNKWGNLPIHKSKKTYQKVPEIMGFPLEEDHNADTLMEDGGMYNEPMYQIAENKMKNWYKKAKKWEDKIPGGNADGKTPDDFERSQVERGKEVEFEHTDDPDTAREITMDHLEEHKDYYTGLEHMENMLKEIEERSKEKKK
jgi:hypothetical protein